MNVSPLQQILGNSFVGLAAIIFLLPLQRTMWNYARKNLNNDSWTAPILLSLFPIWLLLMGALFCVATSGGFDWLPLGRPALYGLTAAAALALGVVSFVFIALYIRPGFTPRVLYVPVIYLVPLTTALLVILSLNPGLKTGDLIQWLRVPWTIFAALCLVGCVGFVGLRFARSGRGGIAGFVHRLRHPAPSSEAILDKLTTLDPHRDFAELLPRTGPGHSRRVRETISAHLRSHPAFIELLTATLHSRSPGDGLSFLFSATLSPEERSRLALPARTAMERFIADIPPPGFIPRERQKQLLKWGRKTFPVIIEKFAGVDVDFSDVIPAFEHALRPDDSQR